MVYRKLNSLAKPDAKLLPRINMLLEVPETNKHAITINLWIGCWQISLEEESRLETAFGTPDGVCKFNRSPEKGSVLCELNRRYAERAWRSRT